MGRDARIEVTWANGDHTLRLGWGEMAELQEHCDAGPFVVLQRLMDGSWLLNDIAHTIRLGLVGGGLEPTKALRLVRDYVEARPPLENTQLAVVVLSAGVKGAPDEEPGKPEAADGAETE